MNGMQRMVRKKMGGNEVPENNIVKEKRGRNAEGKGET